MTEIIDTNIAASSVYVDDGVIEEFVRFMGDEGEDLAKELIGLYLKNVPAMLANIKDDIRSGNIEAIKAHVHGLKGSSAQLGVTGIADECKKIENAIFEGNTDQILPLFEQLEKGYQEVEIYFKTKL
jgi:HPt (histidine-containing phosphotransfer) domain-containing protein